MVQKGIVKSVKSNKAEVIIARSTSCGESCASCGLCPGKDTVVTVLNKIGAMAGDSVTIDMADKKVLSAAALVYITPLIALFAGYFVSYAFFKSETVSIAVGFLCLAAVFGIIILFDKKLKGKYTPRIISIEGEKND